MDYRDMTISELHLEHAKIEAEISRRSVAFWQEVQHLSKERGVAAQQKQEK